MQKNYKNSSIPDLRKKTSYKDELDLNFLGSRYAILTLIMITLLLASVMLVAAGPNSNFPASI
jgi:hypothetical protein